MRQKSMHPLNNIYQQTAPYSMGLFYILLTPATMPFFLTKVNNYYTNTLNIRHLQNTNTNFLLNKQYTKCTLWLTIHQIGLQKCYIAEQLHTSAGCTKRIGHSAFRLFIYTTVKIPLLLPPCPHLISVLLTANTLHLLQL